MKLACSLTLATFSLLWLVYWIWISAVLDPPVTWWAPPLAALLTTASVGALRNGEIIRGDVARLRAALHGDRLVDGRLVGVIGSIEPLREAILAPFSGQPCVVCEYSLHAHGRARLRDSDRDTATSRVTRELFHGHLQTEATIDTLAGRVRMLAYPDLTELSETIARQPDALLRAREYLAQAQPKRVMAQSFQERLEFVHDLATTETGALKKDWREVSDAFMEALLGRGNDREVGTGATSGGSEQDRWEQAVLNDVEFIGDIEFELRERLIEPGEQVSAIGQYCARRNALTPGLGRHARSCHLWVGDPEAVHRQLRSKVRRYLAGGLLGLVAIHAVLFAGTAYAPHSEDLRAARGRKLLATAEAGDVEGVRHWLERGGDPNVLDPAKRTPMWLTEIPQIVRLLIEHGADVNVIGSEHYNEVVLHNACRRGQIEIIDLLIKAGADLDVRNSLGQTPLMEAARYGELAAVQRLVAAGADLNLRSAQNNATALALAREDDEHEVAEFLRKAGGEDDLVTRETGLPIDDATHPAVIACREYLRAAYRADTEAVRQMYSSRTAMDWLETTDWRQHREIWPGDIQDFSGFVRDDDATLSIVGAAENGALVPCEFQLLRENGRWKIVRGRIR